LIQKKQLLREIVERVVVNAEGEILRIELLPPFTYLTNLSQQMQVVEDGNWARNEKTSVCAGCSTCATLCVPDGIQSEHLASKTTSQFLQQLIFPQSAALLHLSNKLQI
jgi:coenzyme F420-reducing hydrogenase gamma subunit